MPLPLHSSQEGGGGCWPLCVLSPNTPHRHVDAKRSPSVFTSPPTGWEDRGGSGEEVWSLVRPGHVREKIAMFTCDPPRRAEPPQEPQEGVEGGEGGVSVGELVAILEQRANQQEPDSKLRLSMHRSPRTDRITSWAEQIGGVVWDLVARLEARCPPVLPSRPQGGGGGAPAARAEPAPGELFFPRGPLPVRDVTSDPSRQEVQPVAPPPCRSHDFLQTRHRIQLLLEPPPYLILLPHHVLLAVLSFLPTRSLAALKCSCRYFLSVVETFGVRPADSLWVSDPRYRDDPCKQCKRRYHRGDASLCRWHHKPYCQALPYGPGFWMCCHGARRDTPGCNMGLHDNRWVPQFHSSVSTHRRGRGAEEEEEGEEDGGRAFSTP